MTYQGDFRTTSPRLISPEASRQPNELFQLTMLRALLLPPRCRDVYVLKEMHGYTPDEIATALSMSTTDVKRHLRRAVREMGEK
jgi:DNA-directed RNA polymerase specialized sigma24 family protein